MAGGKSNPAKARKRVEADNANANDAAGAGGSLVRAKDGSAFARCEECNKDVPVALISFHSCSLDAKIKMNLEAQVVEKPAEVKKKSAERKTSTSTSSSKEPKAKKAKKAKDPNAPKRPPSAFFLFMDDFRKAFKDANPDSKDVKRVAKEGGEKWKSLTDEEKKPYLDKVAELKAEFHKALEANDADNENDEEGTLEKEGEGAEEQEIEDASDAE